MVLSVPQSSPTQEKATCKTSALSPLTTCLLFSAGSVGLTWDGYRYQSPWIALLHFLNLEFLAALESDRINLWLHCIKYVKLKGKLGWGRSGSDCKVTDPGYSQNLLLCSEDFIDTSEVLELFQKLKVHIINTSSNLHLLWLFLTQYYDVSLNNLEFLKIHLFPTLLF